MRILSGQKGAMLVLTLVATGMFLVILLGAISLGLLQQKLNMQKIAQAQALQIAEAGVNYYRWVLYHDHDEYCNKESCLGAPDHGPYGPYEYTDSSGKNIIGYYELYIVPPALNGSTIVTVRSVGWVAGYPNIKRTIEVQCGIPSWSNYSWLLDKNVSFGSAAQVWGKMHSNAGISFDGTAYNTVSSMLFTYDDPDHSGANEYAVHTHNPTDPLPNGSNPPNNISYNNNVFRGGRILNAPKVSFDLLDGEYINNVMDVAISSGIYLPDSKKIGYHITLRPDDKIDIKIVNNTEKNCHSVSPEKITSETNYIIGTSTPPSGVIFVRDKVWVDGSIDGNRVSIFAFGNPLSGDTTDIIINDDITYANYDGTDAIGLIAQNNITIGLYSEDDLRIDAALVAKKGRVGRFAYNISCTDYRRTTLTIHGAIASRERSAFAYYNFLGTLTSGYANRNYIFDNNLVFIPPPHYPSTGEYTFISWKED